MEKAEKAKGGRPSRTLTEEIEATEAKLKELKAKKAAEVKRQRERDFREIVDLLKTEGLDRFPPARWKEQAKGIAMLLEHGTPSKS